MSTCQHCGMVWETLGGIDGRSCMICVINLADLAGSEAVNTQGKKYPMDELCCFYCGKTDTPVQFYDGQMGIMCFTCSVNMKGKTEVSTQGKKYLMDLSLLGLEPDGSVMVENGKTQNGNFKISGKVQTETGVVFFTFMPNADVREILEENEYNISNIFISKEKKEEKKPYEYEKNKRGLDLDKTTGYNPSKRKIDIE